MGDKSHWYRTLWPREAQIFFYDFFLVLTWCELITQTVCPAVPVTWHTQQHTHMQCTATAVKHKLYLQCMLQASTAHRNTERSSTQTSTMAWTKRWFCMQHHAVNGYRKASGVLTFPKTKKIMIQCTGTAYKQCAVAESKQWQRRITRGKTMVQWSSLKILSEIRIQ